MNGYLVRGHMKFIPSVLDNYTEHVKQGELSGKDESYIQNVLKKHCDEIQVELFIKETQNSCKEQEQKQENMNYYRKSLSNVLYDITCLSTKIGINLEELMELRMKGR